MDDTLNSSKPIDDRLQDNDDHDFVAVVVKPKKAAFRRRKRTVEDILQDLMAPIELHPLQESPQSHMILLVGLPGSGKSTFAEALCRLRPEIFERINQDTLGSRNACLAAVASTSKPCPVIDRCNHTHKQRQYFLRLGKPSIVVLFDVGERACRRHCKVRTDHPTVPPEQADRIVGSMCKEYQPPSLKERGTEKIVIVGEKYENCHQALQYCCNLVAVNPNEERIES